MTFATVVDFSMVSSTTITNNPDASDSDASLGTQKLLKPECNLVSTNMSAENNNLKSFPQQLPSFLTPVGPTTSSSLIAPYPAVRSYSNTQTSSSLFNYRNLDVYVVGDVGHPEAKVIRVVHISDTRGVWDSYTEGLPKGHILVHSGDFLDGPPVRNLPPSSAVPRCHNLSKKRRLSSKGNLQQKPPIENWKTKLKAIDDFFRRQPHPYKVFVSGCWDYFGSDIASRPSASEIQKHLPSVIYLEDAWCKILGLKIYGVPWTSADDLRPEDGKSYFTSSTNKLSFKRLLSRVTGSNRRHRCMSSCTTEGTDGRGVFSTTSNFTPTDTVWARAQSSSQSSMCDGFILPDIGAVSERYATVPQDTDILVSHMPAWRPELYSQVVDRIQPLLHLCGHDFSGYGVTWRRGVVFSNAALQLTSTYPQVIRRRKANSSSYASVCSHDTCFNLALTGNSAPSQTTAPFNTGSDSKVIFDLPENYREPCMMRRGGNSGRPRRWRRRLSDFLSRFSFLTPRCYERPQRKPSVSSSSYSYLKQTPSSIAATTVPLQVGRPDERFVYDSTLSASGSGMQTGSSISRRNPLVFDVYVVMEDDQMILPDYSGRDGAHGLSVYSSMEVMNHPISQHRPRPTCSLQ